MTDVTVRWIEDGKVRSGDLSRLDDARRGEWCWVDIVEPTPQGLDVVAAAFGLHHLAVEDCLHAQARSKIDLYASGVFLVWITPIVTDHESASDFELDVFLGPRHLVTVAGTRSAAIADVVARADEIMARGPDFTFHAIIDRLVDGVLETVDDISDELEVVEDVLVKAPRPEELQNLYRLRRRLVGLHRIVGPEREIIRVLARERELVDDEAFRYLQDVGDHLARVEDSIETAREVAAAAMDIYLSSVSNRMNEIMKVLTAVATIFMPLTLISGIYGMNVLRGMWPPADAAWSFSAIIVAMGIIAAWMAWFFRRRNWW